MHRTSLIPAAAIVSALGIIGTSFAATVTGFADVSSSHANAEAVAFVKSEGIVSGYPDGTFKPDRTINRAEFVKIMVEARHTDEEVDDLLSRVRLSAMADVQGGSWYERYVNAARAFGLVSGYPDGTFRPAGLLNFAESAKIFAEAYDLPAATTGIWYEGYVRALASRGAIPSTINGFNDALTRGEMAEMIYRLEQGITTRASRTYEQLAGEQTSRYVGPGCKVGGCSATLCVGENEPDPVSTCEWREVYACYQNARCEKQSDGECGWTETEEFSSCLADHGEATNACAAVLCPVNSRCENGACIPLESSATDTVYVRYTSGVIGNGQESVLFFHADWCPYCKANDLRLKEWYDSGAPEVSTYKVNYDTETELRSRYGVVQQDTFVLIDGEGEKIRMLSFPSEKALKDLVGA